LTAVSAYMGSGVRNLLSLNSWPAAVVKTLVGLCLLMALSELPNAGETRIQPFKVSAIPGRNEFGQSASERNELGESLSERVVNTLRLLQKELRKEIVLFLQPDAEEAQGEVGFALVAASESSSLGGTALGKSEDLEVGNVKIPLSLLIAPIQGPMRWLLGVHLINGSLQAEQQGYALLASSTAGETWKVIWPPTDSAQQVTPISPDVVASLANEFAFKIITTDPTLAPTMTKSWDAFQSFKAGLKKWKEFEAKQDYTALSRANELFREATAKDPGFALAYYRLGLALQRDGQPDTAAKVFQASLKADPTFIPAYIALASILYDLQPDHDLTARKMRVNEARKLWQQIIHFPAWAVSVPNRASAYYGLCRQASRQARRSTDVEVEREHYLAYYYCKQAAALYASLSAATRAKPAIKTGEASVLHTLGMTVGRLQRHPFMGKRPEWDCWRGILQQSPYSHAALRYYRRALALLPDDHRIRCSAARTAYVLGDPEPLQRLDADPGAHVSLANSHRSKVAKDRMVNGHSAFGARGYLLALKEYQEAIDLEPTHVEALTGYAFTFGEWRANLATAQDPDGPGLAIAQRAEAYAHRAVALATDKLDPATEAIARFALGKVLLAQGRPTEAIKELETAIGLAANHPAVHEMRRDLMHACLCAASNKRSGLPEESVQGLEERAVGLLTKTRGNGLTPEFRPYGNRAYGIGPSWRASLCDAEFSMEGLPDPASPF
jgi:tetratricopeptide (TPR) repeat protein